MSGDRDRIQEANEQLDQRARRRQAMAEALNALTPEVIEEQRKRQLEQPVPDLLPVSPEDDAALQAEYDAAVQELDAAEPEDDLSAALAAAVQPVLESEEHVDDLLGIGQFVFQWILVNGDETNPDGYQLGLHVHIAGREPGGHVVDITQEMVDRWQKGAGLQGNRVEHRRFATALVNESVKVGIDILANELAYTLQALMQGLYGTPTETSIGEDDPRPHYDPALHDPEPSDILDGPWDMSDDDFGDDGPFADAPENADEVPE